MKWRKLLLTRKKSLCSICQKPMSEGDSSVSCCGLCGKHQHASCLNFYEEEGVNIKWKCNDCLNKNRNILEVSEELLDHPVENCNVIIEENIEEIGHSEKCLETLTYTEENAISKSSPTETNSKIILADKDDTNENLHVIEIEMIDENVNSNKVSIDAVETDENVNLNKMSTDGEVTNENKIPVDGEGTDENIYVNNISIDGEVTNELTLSPKREVRN
ncbi:hypothetical protein Avbf_01090 [Armadillidium vulgare]|nr:hypothetical protein Avbf_01090 [Armadillidium vulgare]